MSPRLLGQPIRKCYNKSLGTSVRKQPIVPSLSLWLLWAEVSNSPFKLLIVKINDCNERVLQSSKMNILICILSWYHSNKEILIKLKNRGREGTLGSLYHESPKFYNDVFYSLAQQIWGLTLKFDCFVH